MSPSTKPALLSSLKAAGLWHFVIRELRQKDVSKPVVTTFFGSRLEIVSCTVQEKFDLLDDDDDPRIIEAALHDEDFSRLLEDYFMTGDTHNQKWFKTLSTFSVFNGKPLLHFCCERGLSNCVEYLLKYHSVRTAKSPCLQLADPLWQDRKWGNSAFSIAAYLGDVETVKVLVSWAQEHNQLWRALQLKDKKKEDLFQLLQARIEKGQGAKGNPKKAYNLLAGVAGRSQLSDHDMDSVGEASNGGRGRAIVVVDPSPSSKKKGDAGDRLEERCIYSLDETMTLASLSDVFKEMKKETDILQGKSVLIINLKLIPAADGKDDEEALNLLLSLQTCCRVSMKRCVSSPKLCICLAKAIASQLKIEPMPAWESLGLLPEWDEQPGRESPLLVEFADALEMILVASEHTFATCDFIGFDLPPNIRSCVPSARLPVLTLWAQAFNPKRLAHSLRWGGVKAEKLLANLSKNFRAHNPLLSAPASVERALLVKRTLLDSTAVEEALQPSWKWFVGRLIQFWLKQVTSMSLWAAAFYQNDSEMAGVISKIELMLDGAVLHFLKMRPKKGRPGLKGICNVVNETLALFPDWETSLPQSARYMQKIRSPE